MEKNSNRVLNAALVFTVAICSINTLSGSAFRAEAESTVLTVPSFFRVNKFYQCDVNGMAPKIKYQVKKIDSQSGWLLMDWENYDPRFPDSVAHGSGWFNIAHFKLCNEVEGFLKK